MDLSSPPWRGRPRCLLPAAHGPSARLVWPRTDVLDTQMALGRKDISYFCSILTAINKDACLNITPMFIFIYWKPRACPYAMPPIPIQGHKFMLIFSRLSPSTFWESDTAAPLPDTLFPPSLSLLGSNSLQTPCSAPRSRVQRRNERRKSSRISL